MNTTRMFELALGFLLTTVCGGLLGFIFQRRHARYQWLRSRWEKELESAQAVFEEVSRLLDRRLYRARQLLWAVGKSSEQVDAKLSAYREVVTEWNENINRMLALLAMSFGDEQRASLDSQIGAEFVAVGRLLEGLVRGESSRTAEGVSSRLDALGGRVYGFNVRLLEIIREKHSRLHD